MAIKSKSYNFWIKTAAFIIIAAMSFLMVKKIYDVAKTVSDDYDEITVNGFWDFFKSDFTETNTFFNMRYHAMDAAETLRRLESEQAIRETKYDGLELLEIYNLNLLSNEIVPKYRQKYETEILSAIESIYSESKIDIYNTNGIEITDYKMILEKYRDEIESEYAAEIAEIENSIINDRIIEYNYWLDYLNSRNYIVYCITGAVSGNVITNTNKTYGQIADLEYSYKYNDYYNTKDSSGNFIIAFDSNYISLQNKLMIQINEIINRFIIYTVCCFLIWLICFIYLIYAAGRKSSDSREGVKAVRLFKTDRLYNEFTLLLTGGFAWLSCVSLYMLGVMFDSPDVMIIYIKITDLLMTAFVACVVLFVWFLLALVRHIKNRTIITHTLIYTILRFFAKGFMRICKGISTLFSGKNPMFKSVLLFTVFSLLTMIPFIGFITVPMALWFLLRQVKSFTRLKDGVAMIKSGVYDEEINITGKSEYALLANDVNEIAAGLGAEVERRTKSERLKTELIVNVSHDLKTPLTSLITYTDLLMKEETDNENIKKYAEVLMQKSDRLKKLTDDLFESAKAASGNITVNLEKVEVNSLIMQGLAEMDDQVKKSGLEFKTTIPERKVYIKADGKLYWRIMENLLSNILKYSMPNSRVYIDVFENERTVTVSLKNISAVEIAFSEDEITERFKRGDAARSGEGSGLGLDIAKSLAVCQNGELVIRTDGDLFKAEVKMPVY